MNTAQDQIAAVTGIPKREQDEIWKKVIANRDRLKACVGPHDFSIDASPTKPMFKRWRCSKCLGEVEGMHKIWYEQGLKDAAISGLAQGSERVLRDEVNGSSPLTRI